MDRITTDDPEALQGDEESKNPHSAPSQDPDGPAAEMAFEKEGEITTNEVDCISHVEACCISMTDCASAFVNRNRWFLTWMSRLFFIGNVITFQALFVSKSIKQMVNRGSGTPFIVVSTP